MASKKFYKYCCVPECVSSTVSTPEKLFFGVPKGEPRKKWCRIMRRDLLSLKSSTLYCCEDHFNVEEDVQEWIRYKILCAEKQPTFLLRLKKGVVPSRFDCQRNRKATHSKHTRSFILKKRATEAVNDAVAASLASSNFVEAVNDSLINSSPIILEENISEVEPNSGNSDCIDVSTLDITFESDNYGTPPKTVSSITNSTQIFNSSCTVPYESPTSNFTSTCYARSKAEVQNNKEVELNCGNSDCIDVSTLLDITLESDNYRTSPKTLPSVTTSTQTFNSSFTVPNESLTSFTSTCPARSEAEVQVHLRTSFKHKLLQVSAPTLTKGTSPVKGLCVCGEADETDEEDEPDEADHDHSFRVHTPECLNSSYCSNEWEGGKEVSDETMKQQYVQHNMKIMEQRCRSYFGVDTHNLFVFELLQTFVGCTKKDLMIVLRKVRKNEANADLGDYFGLSASGISRVLLKHLPNVAALLSTYIFWPEEQVIHSNLPIAFRANYSRVQSIIDCFEVEIEKPLNARHQALTWSDYKKCNTVKFLISCTPDGYINYISKGYGGRATDVEIVTKCGYLDVLRPRTVVMADRGFKHIDYILRERNCFLVRPPSVENGTQMSEVDVRQTKIVASLRIHVERVIKRVREYTFLEAHSRIHHNLMPLVDHICIIACGLSNLQASIIKRC